MSNASYASPCSNGIVNAMYYQSIILNSVVPRSVELGYTNNEQIARDNNVNSEKTKNLCSYNVSDDADLSKLEGVQ